ncbi:hypothetical protein D910_00100 [Dendroctonus ponderosae]|uniref:Nose resistant-to-fluoxetine protein N-terminal domain-containing protein n=1 Tax=Dendroctonus ponderosae TaxID=77166 RepID=U4URE1_DENPD|nr:hypothetical protein D910_00100 [Dendroctonus ponderosae]
MQLLARTLHSVCVDLPETCMPLIAQLRDFLSNNQETLRDSSAKSVQGILRGSIAQFGHFEECLTAKAPFPTQFCMATVSANVPEPNNPRDPKSLIYGLNDTVISKIYDKKDPAQQPENAVLLGWCIPASCKPSDLQEYLNEYLSNAVTALTKENVTYSSQIIEQSCQTDLNHRNWDHLDISFLYVLVRSQ